MGHDFSKAVYASECGVPERQFHEFSDSDIDVDGVTSKSVESKSEEGAEFFSPFNSLNTPVKASAQSYTVIIFDWDDTLLCSTAINTQQWSVKQLRDLEMAVESILATAMGLGETLIVTNGNATWVQDSAKRFLPRLLPTLAKLTVVSARALYESLYPGDPFMWKKAAFQQLLCRDRQVHVASGLNLIALGDQHPEIEAAHSVVKIIGGTSLVKTVKFKEAPSIPELLGQLSRAEHELSKLVSEGHSAVHGMVRRELPPHLDHLVSQGAGWRFATKEDNTWSFPRSLSLKDLWPLFS